MGDSPTAPLPGEATHGDWPWMKGLDSEVEDIGV